MREKFATVNGSYFNVVGLMLKWRAFSKKMVLLCEYFKVPHKLCQP